MRTMSKPSIIREEETRRAHVIPGLGGGLVCFERDIGW